MCWTGYGFVDRDLDENELDERDFQYDGMHEDPIASNNAGDSIDANTPIRDPRLYFLAIFEIRIIAVLREWEVLVRFMERGIESKVCFSLSFLS
jgi:hypothetical protein